MRLRTGSIALILAVSLAWGAGAARAQVVAGAPADALQRARAP